MDKSDIKAIDDVHLLVHSFYNKVRKDILLSPIFDAVIKTEDWDFHLSKMCEFWNSILLNTRSFRGDPAGKHLPLPINAQHFSRWLFLFSETVDELFSGETAEMAKSRAFGIGNVMQAMKGIQ
ncbi:MAG: group III truncated hemoglobin [Bacteroidia bacterium]